MPQHHKNWPSPASIKTPGTQTGLSHPRCYARELGDCSDTISREHFFPESILELMGEVRVSGMPWQTPGEERTYSPNNLAANVLCKRHNEALSPLDERLKKIFERIARIDAAMRERSHRLLHLIPAGQWFWGHDLERGLLKAFLGSWAAGNLTFPDGRVPRNSLPPLDLVQYLFTARPWQVHHGLYYRAVIGTKHPVGPGLSISIEPMRETVTGTITGLRAGLNSCVFAVALGTHFDTEYMHRPRELKFTLGAAMKALKMRW